jgi:hypothetical protein
MLVGKQALLALPSSHLPSDLSQLSWSSLSLPTNNRTLLLHHLAHLTILVQHRNPSTLLSLQSILAFVQPPSSLIAITADEAIPLFGLTDS